MRIDQYYSLLLGSMMLLANIWDVAVRKLPLWRAVFWTVAYWLPLVVFYLAISNGAPGHVWSAPIRAWQSTAIALWYVLHRFGHRHGME